MSKSVIIICNSYPPEKGAAPTRIYNLAKMLHSKGYEVEVIAALPNYPTGRIFPGYRNKLVHQEENEGVKVKRLWLYPSNSRSPLQRIVSMISQSVSLYVLGFPKLIFRKPDIILVSTPPILLGYNGILIAKMLGAKAVLNVSDIWPLSALELGAIQEGRFYRILEKVEKSMYRMADVCVGQSIEILERIDKVQAGKKKFLYRNLQEISPFAHSSKLTGKRKIVYAGMLGVAQGVLEICKQVNFDDLGVELHIYGEGVETEALIRFLENNQQRGIFYHGSIPGAEIPAMLARHHATLIPLKTMIHGAVPSKIFMAMANAIPVLFSGSGEGAKIVCESGIGWVNPPGDFEALTRNIQQFVSLTDDEYQQMRDKCILAMNTSYNKKNQETDFANFLSTSV